MALKLDERTLQCLVCGTPSNQRVLQRAASPAAQDLDFRPGGLERVALTLAVQRCPRCGYCGDSIGRVPGQLEEDALRSLLSSPEYHGRLLDPHQPDLARNFRCRSLIMARAGAYDEAGQAMLMAAWVADDIGAVAAAADSRIEGAELFAVALADDGLPPDRAASIRLAIIDMLRRAGRFPQAANAARHLREATDDPRVRGVAAYQSALIEAHNTDAHGFDEALPSASRDITGGRSHLLRLVGLFLCLLILAGAALLGLKGPWP